MMSDTGLRADAEQRGSCVVHVRAGRGGPAKKPDVRQARIQEAVLRRAARKKVRPAAARGTARGGPGAVRPARGKGKVRPRAAARGRPRLGAAQHRPGLSDSVGFYIGLYYRVFTLRPL